MRALVLGSTGFLGSYLGFALPRHGWHTHGVSRVEAPWFPRNRVVTAEHEIAALVGSGEFDVVINAIAMASHEACEANPEAAHHVNATLPGLWAAAAESAGVQFVHISTDAVFDGNSEGAYREDDEARPAGVYGASKLAGEIQVAQASPRALIVRTNFFGWSRGGRTGILDFFVSAFQDQKPITGFSDYVVSSVYVGHLTGAIVAAIENKLTGIHHIVASDALSKYDFGLLIAGELGLDASCMSPGILAGATHLSARGRNLALSTEKIESALGAPMASCADGLRLAVAEKSLVMDYFGHRVSGGERCED